MDNIRPRLLVLARGDDQGHHLRRRLIPERGEPPQGWPRPDARKNGWGFVVRLGDEVWYAYGRVPRSFLNLFAARKAFTTSWRSSPSSWRPLSSPSACHSCGSYDRQHSGRGPSRKGTARTRASMGSSQLSERWRHVKHGRPSLTECRPPPTSPTQYPGATSGLGSMANDVIAILAKASNDLDYANSGAVSIATSKRRVRCTLFGSARPSRSGVLSKSPAITELGQRAPTLACQNSDAPALACKLKSI